MDKGGMHADTWTRFFLQILLLGAHNRAVLQTAPTDALKRSTLQLSKAVSCERQQSSSRVR